MLRDAMKETLIRPKRLAFRHPKAYVCETIGSGSGRRWLRDGCAPAKDEEHVSDDRGVTHVGWSAEHARRIYSLRLF
jgi:hypothetical protein